MHGGLNPELCIRSKRSRAPWSWRFQRRTSRTSCACRTATGARDLPRVLSLAAAATAGTRPRANARGDGRLQREDQRVLLTKRVDDETWCLPAGAAEPGGSFARTAIDELAEETGICVTEGDLIPFGSLSEAEAHTIHYPNGDVTHCFAMLFLARAWEGEPRPDQAEVSETEFVDLSAPPTPLHAPDRACARATDGLPKLRLVSGALTSCRLPIRSSSA